MYENEPLPILHTMYDNQNKTQEKHFVTLGEAYIFQTPPKKHKTKHFV